MSCEQGSFVGSDMTEENPAPSGASCWPAASELKDRLVAGKKMSKANQDAAVEAIKFDQYTDITSPVYVEGGNLYVNATEWDRLCKEPSTSPLLDVLLQVSGFLSRDKSVRLINADGGIAVSADQPSEFQIILDNANHRRASLGLAPAIPIG